METETLEEVAENKFGKVNPTLGKSDYRMGYESGLIAGAKWQQKRMYSEEECYKTLHNLMTDIKLQGLIINDDIDLKKWFNQFKKK